MLHKVSIFNFVVRPFPQGMPGMNPHMMRKLPHGFNAMDMPQMDMMMMQQQMMMNMPNPMMMHNNEMPPEIMNNPNAKRDFYGEKLYSKISSNPNFTTVGDLFSKIVGIFLDLEDSVIERLIRDDNYFDLQVRETMRLLAERGSS